MAIQLEVALPRNNYLLAPIQETHEFFEERGNHYEYLAYAAIVALVVAIIFPALGAFWFYCYSAETLMALFIPATALLLKGFDAVCFDPLRKKSNLFRQLDFTEKKALEHQTRLLAKTDEQLVVFHQKITGAPLPADTSPRELIPIYARYLAYRQEAQVRQLQMQKLALTPPRQEALDLISLQPPPGEYTAETLQKALQDTLKKREEGLLKLDPPINYQELLRWQASRQRPNPALTKKKISLQAEYATYENEYRFLRIHMLFCAYVALNPNHHGKLYDTATLHTDTNFPARELSAEYEEGPHADPLITFIAQPKTIKLEEFRSLQKEATYTLLRDSALRLIQEEAPVVPDAEEIEEVNAETAPLPEDKKEILRQLVQHIPLPAPDPRRTITPQLTTKPEHLAKIDKIIKSAVLRSTPAGVAALCRPRSFTYRAFANTPKLQRFIDSYINQALIPRFTEGDTPRQRVIIPLPPHG